MVGENSRTMMLIEVLTSEFEDKTVKDVVDALTRMTRNDVIKIITDVYPGMLLFLFSVFFLTLYSSQMLVEEFFQTTAFPLINLNLQLIPGNSNKARTLGNP